MAHSMLSALKKLHAMGLCHRDVKPGNFCLGHLTEERQEGKMYLIDYGASACQEMR
jgi:serine/threonine protein kinase